MAESSEKCVFLSEYTDTDKIAPSFVESTAGSSYPERFSKGDLLVIGDYYVRLGERLGLGLTAGVYRVSQATKRIGDSHIEVNEPLVAKVLHPEVTELTHTHFTEEADVLSSLKRCQGTRDFVPIVYVANEIMILMEMISEDYTSLAKYIARRRKEEKLERLSIDHVLNIADQVFSFLQSLHEEIGKAYTDMQLQNFFYNLQTGELKIIDWNHVSTGRAYIQPDELAFFGVETFEQLAKKDLQRFARYLMRLLDINIDVDEILEFMQLDSIHDVSFETIFGTIIAGVNKSVLSRLPLGLIQVLSKVAIGKVESARDVLDLLDRYKDDYEEVGQMVAAESFDITTETVERIDLAVKLGLNDPVARQRVDQFLESDRIIEYRAELKKLAEKSKEFKEFYLLYDRLFKSVPGHLYLYSLTVAQAEEELKKASGLEEFSGSLYEVLLNCIKADVKALQSRDIQTLSSDFTDFPQMMAAVKLIAVLDGELEGRDLMGVEGLVEQLNGFKHYEVIIEKIEKRLQSPPSEEDLVWFVDRFRDNIDGEQRLPLWISYSKPVSLRDLIGRSILVSKTLERLRTNEDKIKQDLRYCEDDVPYMSKVERERLKLTAMVCAEYSRDAAIRMVSRRFVLNGEINWDAPVVSKDERKPDVDESIDADKDPDQHTKSIGILTRQLNEINIAVEEFSSEVDAVLENYLELLETRVRVGNETVSISEEEFSVTIEFLSALISKLGTAHAFYRDASIDNGARTRYVYVKFGQIKEIIERIKQNLDSGILDSESKFDKLQALMTRGL